MSNGFLAGDNIAMALESAANAARARRTLATQQAYYCGEVAVKKAALSALREVAPDHPLFQPGVQDRIFSAGEVEFMRHGWARGSTLQIDPQAVFLDLKSEFETTRAKAIAKAEAEPIKSRRRGWLFLNRRTVFCWRGQDHETEHAAIEAKRAEVARLAGARLGDRLNFS